MTEKKKSWRTTTAAVATGLAAIATAVATWAAGGEIDWSAVGTAIVGIATAFGLLAARDNKAG